MDQEPVQAPSESTDGKPKIFQNINGVIAGVTGLVIAVGGLAAATREMWDKEPEQAATSKTEALADTSQSSVQPNAVKAKAESAATAPTTKDPWYFSTNMQGSIRWEGGLWVVKDRDNNAVRYDHISADDYENVAYSATGGTDNGEVYLRWPKAGGRAQKSLDNQESWRDEYMVTVDEKQPANS